jgi:RNA polymerase-binding protein DksA
MEVVRVVADVDSELETVASSGNGVPAKRAAAKRAPAKTVVKAATKKAAATKVAEKKAPAKKVAAKKVAAKKVAAKKVAAKEVAAKEVAAKEAPAKKVPAKKVAAKKSAPAKTAAKTAAAAKESVPRKAAADDVANSAALPSDWTRDELAEVLGELNQELGELRAELAHGMSELDDLQQRANDGAGDDQADAGSKAFEREQELSLLHNKQELITQAEHAVERIGSGTYGRCEGCGAAIAKARLQAFPSATLCVTCKQRQERR